MTAQGQEATLTPERLAELRAELIDAGYFVVRAVDLRVVLNGDRRADWTPEDSRIYTAAWNALLDVSRRR